MGIPENDDDDDDDGNDNGNSNGDDIEDDDDDMDPRIHHEQLHGPGTTLSSLLMDIGDGEDDIDDDVEDDDEEVAGTSRVTPWLRP
jgi:hypothetical protein